MRHPPVTTENKWFQLSDQTIGVYNYLDCLATAQVHAAQTAEQQEHEQHRHYREVWWPLVAPIMAMARRGLTLDRTVLAAHHQTADQELAEAQSVCGPEVNLNSPPQRAKLLYDGLGLRCPHKTPTGARSTDQFALDAILRNLRVQDRHAVPVLHAMFHRSRWNTIQSRYLSPRIDPQDLRVRPTIKMASAETLRLAYADPPVQQYPKEIRDMFVPSAPDRSFIGLDYSQLEARIAAILADDEPSLRVFSADEDIHTINAQDLGFTVVTEKHRSYAKTFLYGITYGGRAESLKMKLFCPCPKCASTNPDVLQITKADRVAAERRWFQRHPRVLRFRNDLAGQVRKNRYLTSQWGYRRYFFAPAHAILPEVYDWPMQTNAAELVNERFIRLHDAGLIPAIQLHDEIVLEAPDAEVPAVAAQARAIMEAPVPQLDGHVFPVKVTAGKNWRDMEPLTL